MTQKRINVVSVQKEQRMDILTECLYAEIQLSVKEESRAGKTLGMETSCGGS